MLLDDDASLLSWPTKLKAAADIARGMNYLHKYGTFQQHLLYFCHSELGVRGHTQVWGAAFSCPRLKWADVVLI